MANAPIMSSGPLAIVETRTVHPIVLFGANGRVFNVRGGEVSVAEGWVAGPGEDKGARWDPNELGEVIPRIAAEARRNSDMRGRTPTE